MVVAEIEKPRLNSRLQDDSIRLRRHGGDAEVLVRGVEAALRRELSRRNGHLRVGFAIAAVMPVIAPLATVTVSGVVAAVLVPTPGVAFRPPAAEHSFRFRLAQ